MSLTLTPAAQANDRDQERLQRRAAKIGVTIRNIQIHENSKIPPAIMENAKGIIVLRQYEAGFLFGAKGGFGMALRRDESGEWGPPAWIKTGEFSGGLQIGVQTLNVVFVIMSEEGLKMLQKPKFSIGVDATVTAGPTGTNVQANIGSDAALLAYTDTEGLYMGATFQGGFLLPDNKSNLLTYQKPLSVSEIISSESLPLPDFAEPITTLLRQIEAEDD